MAKKLTENISTSANGRSAGVPSSVFHRNSPTTADAAAAATDIASGSGTSSAAAPTLNSSIIATPGAAPGTAWRSEEHTSELQSLMRTSYAVFCLKNNTEDT